MARVRVVVRGSLEGSFYRREVDMNYWPACSSCRFNRGEPELTRGRWKGGLLKLDPGGRCRGGKGRGVCVEELQEVMQRLLRQG